LRFNGSDLSPIVAVEILVLVNDQKKAAFMPKVTVKGTVSKVGVCVPSAAIKEPKNASFESRLHGNNNMLDPVSIKYKMLVFGSCTG